MLNYRIENLRRQVAHSGRCELPRSTARCLRLMGGSKFSCSGGLTPPSRNGRTNRAVWVTGVNTRCTLPDGWPPLPPKIPRNTTAAYRCCNLLPQALLNYWPPRHQTEPLSIVEHRVPPTGEHDLSLDSRGCLAFARTEIVTLVPCEPRAKAAFSTIGRLQKPPH